MDFDSLALEVQAVDRSPADSPEIGNVEIDRLEIESPDFETAEADKRSLAALARAAEFPKLAGERKSAARKDCASAAVRLGLVPLGEQARLTLGHIALGHID